MFAFTSLIVPSYWFLFIKKENLFINISVMFVYLHLAIRHSMNLNNVLLYVHKRDYH